MRIKFYFKTSLWFWTIIALYGVLLRWHANFPLPFIKNYAYWLHAHSHVAFLGWLHAASVVLLSRVLLPEFSESRTFRFYFVFSQLMPAGMLVSFPVQGYKVVSIILLSVFLLTTYYFAYIFWKKNENQQKFPTTTAFAKAAVVFMLISSLSPWALGPVMVFLGKQSVWYHLDIYFYLHFQYNGWFFLAMLALIIHWFEKNNLKIPEHIWKKSLFWLFKGIFWGYITNTLWTDPPLYFNMIALLSVLMEAWGLWLIGRFLFQNLHTVFSDKFSKRIFYWLVFAIVIKTGLQFLASCPYYANLAYSVRDLVIGYLHWVMLALLSPAFVYLAQLNGLIQLKKMHFGFYLTAVLSMILWIWLRGWLIWHRIAVPDWVNMMLLILTVWTFSGTLLITWYANKKV